MEWIILIFACLGVYILAEVADRLNYSRKMCYVSVDVSTTGVDAEKDSVVQLSYQVRDIATNKKIKSRNYYFASDVSEEQKNDEGLLQGIYRDLRVDDKKKAFESLMKEIRSCRFCIGHNIKGFDRRFILKEMERLGIDRNGFDNSIIFDTMEETTNLCKIPHKDGTQGYKSPKLIELAEYLGVDYSEFNLYDSADDAELTARCFSALNQKGYFNIDKYPIV